MRQFARVFFVKIKNLLLRLAGCAAAAAALLAASGCELSVLEVDNYMRPPFASGYSAGIQQALNETLGSQFTLRYPRSGEYRSAVVLADIDGTPGDEAIVFYRMSTESSGAHMIVLDCMEDDSWQVIGKAESSGGEIDRILLCDINADGVRELVSGWSGLADNGIVNIHSISDGELRSVNIAKNREGAVPANEYSEMVVGDFDGDMQDELMTVCRSSADGTAYARMLEQSYDADGAIQLSVVGAVSLDGAVYKYENAQAGFIGGGVFAMVLDGSRSKSEHTTEIVCWNGDEKALFAPLNDENTHSAGITRSLPTISADIDGDGVIEIPENELMQGYSPDSDSAMYLTAWSKMTENGMETAMRALMRSEQGYYFIFPEGWEETVTVQADSDKNTMHFFRVDSEELYSSELFRIKIFTRDEWAKRSKESEGAVPAEEVEYIELAETEYYVYAALLMSGAQELGINAEMLLESFVPN